MPIVNTFNWWLLKMRDGRRKSAERSDPLCVISPCRMPARFTLNERQSRRASSNAVLMGSHVPSVKYPQMRRNLPRGPGGQFRRKKSSNLSTPQRSEPESSDDGSNGDDEEDEDAHTHAGRSTRASISLSATKPSAPELVVKVEAPGTPTMEETRQSRTRSMPASKSSTPNYRDALLTTTMDSARSRMSARHSAPNKSFSSGGHLKEEQETPLSSVRQEMTTRKPSENVTRPRLLSHNSTPDRTRRHTRSSKAQSDNDTSSRQESDDAPKRVLRPRTSRTTADGAPDAKMDISPTAPHIRQLNTLQKRTEKIRPTWKGWVSIPNGACDVCFQVHEELKGREPVPDEKLICNR